MSWKMLYDEVQDASIWYKDHDVLHYHTPSDLSALYCGRFPEPDLSLFKIRSGEKWGIADAEGTVLVPPEFDGIGPLPECPHAFLFWSNDHSSYGLVARGGSVLLAPEYSYILRVEEDRVLAVRYRKDFSETQAVWLDWKGQVIAVPDWHFAEKYVHFISGLVPVTRDGKYAYLDLMGRIIGDAWWDEVGEFGGSSWGSSNEFAARMTWVKQGNRYGFIDICGNTVIPPVFEEVTDFGSGYDGMHCIMNSDRAAVRLYGKWGYINDKGEWIVDCAWDKANAYENGFCSVISGSKRDTLTKEGFPCRSIREFQQLLEEESGHPFAFGGDSARSQKIKHVSRALNVFGRLMIRTEDMWSPRKLIAYVSGILPLIDLLLEADACSEKTEVSDQERTLYDAVIPELKKIFREKPECTPEEKTALDNFLLQELERYLAPYIERWDSDETLRASYEAQTLNRDERIRRMKERLAEKKKQRSQAAEEEANKNNENKS